LGRCRDGGGSTGGFALDDEEVRSGHHDHVHVFALAATQKVGLSDFHPASREAKQVRQAARNFLQHLLLKCTVHTLFNTEPLPTGQAW